MIAAFDIALIENRWYVTAFVDRNGNRLEPLAEARDQSLRCTPGPVLVGGPLWYLNLDRQMLSVRECWKCGETRKELRGLNPNDCGGCETCNQHFGGVFVCANGDCDQSKERDMLDTEGYGYLV